MALPEPSFIVRDPEAVAAEMVASYEASTGKALQPAQVESILIDLIAYRESLIRVAIQEAAKQNLVEYAIFPMLDYLGELVGVVRLAAQAARCSVRFYLTEAQAFDVTVPAGTRIETKDALQIFETEFSLTISAGQASGDVSAICQAAGSAGNGYVAGAINNLLDVIANVNSAVNVDTTANGSDEESDDAMRQRIKLAPEAFSNAGSSGAYRFWARSAHPDIISVAVSSPSAGVVNVYPLTKYGNPDQDMLDLVAATLTDEKVRPLTDQVNVLAPTQNDYTITAAVTLYEWADSDAVLASIELSLQAYADAQRSSLGLDVVVSQIVTAISGIYGVYKAVVSAPAADVVNEANEWGNCTNISVNLAGLVNG